MAKLVNELKILQFKNVYLFRKKLAYGFAEQTATNRHRRYTNPLGNILTKKIEI